MVSGQCAIVAENKASAGSQQNHTEHEDTCGVYALVGDANLSLSDQL